VEKIEAFANNNSVLSSNKFMSVFLSPMAWSNLVPWSSLHYRIDRSVPAKGFGVSIWGADGVLCWGTLFINRVMVTIKGHDEASIITQHFTKDRTRSGLSRPGYSYRCDHEWPSLILLIWIWIFLAN
jgi:hypothetical protein